MANTYLQVFLHIVFAVKFRRAQIPVQRSEEVYKYIGGVVKNFNRCKYIAIGGIPDHVHMLVRVDAVTDIAELVKAIKVSTTLYINRNGIVPNHNFSWQEGYGAFSVSATHTDAVVNYINNQMEHHKNEPFLVEYRRLLEKNLIDFDERYIFTEPIV